jgi:hypothetical protein
VKTAMKPILSALVLLVLALEADPAHAYAWMIRHGLAECRRCHVDPMGGETLTGNGRITIETRLSQPWTAETPSDLGMFLFGVEEPNGVRLGGSFRGMALADLETGKTALLPMQADLYGAALVGKLTVGLSAGVSRASRRYEHASKARIAGDVEDEGILLVSRSHWLGYDLSDDVILRVGRLNLPFGIRTPEHTLWVRSETSTDRESDQQHGVSLVFTSGRLRGEVLGSLGNFQISPDAIRERGYSGNVEYVLAPRLALGVSSLLLAAEREVEIDQGAFTRQAHGITARYSPWQPLVVLAEADLLKTTGSGLGYVGMAMFDLEPVQGLHFAVTGEVLDRGKPDLGGAGAGRGEPRFGTWLTANWFFGPHFDLRVDLVLRQLRAAMLQTQLHFYL